MTRLLAIMGSGETAPTMIKTHRAVVQRLGPSPVRGLLLDTPFGFQMNADDIAARAVEYFHQSVGADLEVAGLRRAEDLEGPGGDALAARIAAADLVFAGPGSPSYALRQWHGTLVPGLLAEKLDHGGAVTFASAAALTLGVVTVPVYEIYKVGDDPRWLDGLDLLGPLGLSVAVIPHYDNAEGGTHDTRFCYLGEERLALLEQSLPGDAFVIGVDEHTALLLDFESSTAEVTGRGVVTVRVAGRSAVFESGTTLALSQLGDMAAELRSGSTSPQPRATAAAGVPAAAQAPRLDRGASPLLDAIRARESEFRDAQAGRDVQAMVGCALALEEELWAWRADTMQSDDAGRGRAALRAMVLAIGDMASQGPKDPAALIGPYVELLLSLRDEARAARRFDDADAVRDRLTTLGVEVRDGPEGSTWVAH
ncbi:MAG: CysS/YqeB C-terminal domain-containing protein [Acidimicrobiales bacterium]